MSTFISLLRGINVGGKRKIRMADLRHAYESAGLTNVETHVQSGNVLFDCGMRIESKIAALLERQIETCFGYEVTVVLRTPGEFRRIIDGNPFSTHAKKDTAKVHVTFLASRPRPTMVKNVAPAEMGRDEFFMREREIFLHCPNGYGRTKINNAYFERKLKTPATTRNWKTVQALNEMVMRR